MEKLREQHPERPVLQMPVDAHDLDKLCSPQELEWSGASGEDDPREDPRIVPHGQEGKQGCVTGMIVFIDEKGHTGAIYGELRTGRWANLAELNSVVGVKTDGVSALTMRFILDKGLYTPQEVDESLWAAPLVSLEPAEQGSPKRLKLEESEYSAAGEQEDEHMQELSLIHI